MWVYYSLAALVILQGLLSLRGGVRYLAYFRRELEAKRPLYMPPASIVVPCRGMDRGSARTSLPSSASTTRPTS